MNKIGVIYFKDDYTHNLDEPFAHEYEIIKSVCPAQVLSRTQAPDGNRFIYRGWMMSDEEYTKMYNTLGKRLVVSPEQHDFAHYINLWYKAIEDHTFNTVFFDRHQIDDIKDWYANNRTWKKSFVKDYVKSLTTQRGSVAKNLSEIHDIVHELETYHGVNKGISIREYHDLDHDSERRHFVLNGQVFKNNNKDTISSEIMEAISDLTVYSPFFAIDTIFDKAGRQWIVEIGDAQMSEFKGWSDRSIRKLFKAIAEQ